MMGSVGGAGAFRAKRMSRALGIIAVTAMSADAAPGHAQTSFTWIGVALDDQTRRADDELRRYLERTAGIAFVSEQAYEYRAVIDRLVDWQPDRGVYMARVTPYALVAAELLGAEFQVLATYVSRATGGTTYASYFVVRRDRFPFEPSLAHVAQFVTEAATPPAFVYHSGFSTSSYFLPAIFFRRNDIFDMATATEQAGAIRTRWWGSNSAAVDLVKAVAVGESDLAAIWSGTKAAFEAGDSLAARYGRRVHFIELPTPLPNDLLVVPRSLDSATVALIRRAIGGMTSNQIARGDFLTWRDLNDAPDAREALANLRWLAREAPAPATVEIRRAAGDRAVPDDYLYAARQAVRLAGLELVNYDRDYHAQQDYLLTLEPIHDGAVLLRSKIVGSTIEDQEFRISFRDPEELTSRIGELLRSRIHRVRYLWPYRAEPPTLLRDVDFDLPVGTTLKVRKIRWLDVHRNAFVLEQEFDATVARSDFHKFELQPTFVDAPDRDGFGFNPMSNVSYRVVLARSVHERPGFRLLTVALVVLITAAGAAAALELRRALRTTSTMR
jgi:ABC-type phosphate/phosphonate transport system substrate-binding protein